jgi:glyoxylase-like metal-dependent hydrolase (beta-lactamase superfamily II)/ferredoxin
MANRKLRLSGNIEGDFYVDETCIDCDTCRQMAPGIFRDHAGRSVVHRQPVGPEEVQQGLRALVACPTGSIGTSLRHDSLPAIHSFPKPIDGEVYFCGFPAESSFGAWSYLIVRSESDGGNVMIDSPRYLPALVRQIESLGGVRTMLLTHRDDVADHAKYARAFGCRRVMHAADGAPRLGIDQVIEGSDSIQLEGGITIIPTPGHTRGHIMFLYRERYLFTGDSLAWSPDEERLTAFPDVCWYSWSRQTESLTRLLDYRFEWVLPGHGRIGHATADEMHAHLERCVEWMGKIRG